MKRLIIISGTMGVGKTVTCEKLNKELENSVWLDGDWCWLMDPFVVNESTKAMVMDNITHLLRNFLNQDSYKNIIFNWILDEEQIFEQILIPLADLNFILYKFTLCCSDKTLISRLQNDINNGKRNPDCVERSLLRQNKYKKLSTIKINTDDKELDDIVIEIKNQLE